MNDENILRILFVEDFLTDTEIAVRELQKSDLVFKFMRVDAREAFERTLEEYRPDIIVSDYMLPEFDGMQALKLALSFDRFMPFIVLTGSMNEDTAVACMKAGATDYVIKEHITRLPYAVREALEKSRVQREKDAAIGLLRESEERYKSLFQNNHAVMLLINPENSMIIDANPAACRYYGWTYQELTHRSFSDITVPPEPDSESAGGMGINLNDEYGYYILKHKMSDNALCDVEIYSVPILLNGKTLNYCIIHDITGRRQAEEKIRKGLREKEILLRELYHRTKNNMQVIIAMLTMQSESTRSEEVKKIIQETNNRIHAMALVHKMLYQFGDLSQINLKDYFTELIFLLIKSFQVSPAKIKVRMDMETILVFIDTAISCGLILNELISNVFIHAFPGDEKGEISVRLFQKDGDMIVLEVCDNGTGVPADFDFRSQKTLGLQIIFSIAESQLMGDVEFIPENGIKCVISFKNTARKFRP